MKSIFTNIAVIIGLVVLLILTVGSFVFGRMSINCPNQEKVVNSTIILEKITEQYFVVTKSFFMNEEIVVRAEQNSDWENFLWGKEISGSATVRIDYGVDLSGLSEESIVVDNFAKTVKISIPEPEILDSSIYGDIEYQTERGIFKSIEDLIKNDENADYNSITSELIVQATNAVESDINIASESSQDTKELLGLIVAQFGYVLID